MHSNWRTSVPTEFINYKEISIVLELHYAKIYGDINSFISSEIDLCPAQYIPSSGYRVWK